MSKEPERPGREPEKPTPAYAIELAPEILQPDITEKLLNAQLAEALFLMRDAGFLYRNSARPGDERDYCVSQTVKLLSASGAVAQTIARLKESEARAKLKNE
jgi:hypothetical protein